MTIKVFVDSDVILDVLLQREQFYKAALSFLIKCENGEYTACTSALAVANIYYIISKRIENPKQAIVRLSKIVKILDFESSDINSSISSNFDDFEDGIQHSIALRNKCSHIVTRNTKDYRNSLIPLLNIF